MHEKCANYFSSEAQTGTVFHTAMRFAEKTAGGPCDMAAQYRPHRIALMAMVGGEHYWGIDKGRRAGQARARTCRLT
jgi:hypothetical protein